MAPLCGSSFNCQDSFLFIRMMNGAGGRKRTKATSPSMVWGWSDVISQQPTYPTMSGGLNQMKMILDHAPNISNQKISIQKGTWFGPEWLKLSTWRRDLKLMISFKFFSIIPD
jgi:hypothetical protein